MNSVMMDIMWKVGTLLIILTIVTSVKVVLLQSNATEISRCQGKAYDPHFRKALNKTLKVTNASLWEGRDV